MKIRPSIERAGRLLLVALAVRALLAGPAGASSSTRAELKPEVAVAYARPAIVYRSIKYSGASRPTSRRRCSCRSRTTRSAAPGSTSWCCAVWARIRRWMAPCARRWLSMYPTRSPTAVLDPSAAAAAMGSRMSLIRAKSPSAGVVEERVEVVGGGAVAVEHAHRSRSRNHPPSSPPPCRPSHPRFLRNTGSLSNRRVNRCATSISRRATTLVERSGGFPPTCRHDTSRPAGSLPRSSTSNGPVVRHVGLRSDFQGI